MFEKHVADEYGRWRLHGKILPDWLPAGTQQPVLRTMRRPESAMPAAGGSEPPVAESRPAKQDGAGDAGAPSELATA